VPDSPHRDPGLEAALRNQRRPRHHHQRFITATGFLSSATLGLAVYAPRHRLIDLQVVGASLAEVIAYLTAAIGGTRRRSRTRTCQGTGRVPGRRGTAMTGPGNADRAAWAAQAIEAFQSAAGHHGGLDTAEAAGNLITALCHYADRRGISFGEILTASSDAYCPSAPANSTLTQPGDEVRIRDGAVLAPSLATLPRLGTVTTLYPSARPHPAVRHPVPRRVNAMPFTGSEIEPAPPFQPVRTRQGTVASLAEAEEVLISTAARIQISHLHKTRPARADVKDRHLLASVLGQACGLTPEEMLRQAEIQVTATVRRELAMQAAADLGREHARTGARPFETELETAARLADVLARERVARCREMTPARESCSGIPLRNSATRKRRTAPAQAAPIAKGILLRRPSWPDGTSGPGRPAAQRHDGKPAGCQHPAVRRAP